MSEKEPEDTFCLIYTAYTGEPIDDIKQLVQVNKTGEELMEFCEFYSSQILDKAIDEIRKNKEPRHMVLSGHYNSGLNKAIEILTNLKKKGE